MYTTNKMYKTKDYYYERLKKCVEAKGGKLVSTSYTTTRAYYDYICAQGHPCNVKGGSIVEGKGCKKCTVNSKEHGEKTFKEAVELRGGKVIGTYVNSETNVETMCEFEHIWKPRPSDVKNGHWCSKCAGLCPIQSEERFNKVVEFKGGVVIGTYTGDKVPLDIKCVIGHIFPMRPNDVKDGHWCPWCVNCSPDKAGANVKQIIEDEGGVMLSPYINNKTPILARCSKKHERWTSSTKIQKRNWCTDCGGSSYEKKALAFLINNDIPYKSQYGIPGFWMLIIIYISTNYY